MLERKTSQYLLHKSSRMKLKLVLFLIFIGIVSSCKESYTHTGSIIEVAEHYNGADATVLQVTDQYFPPYNSNVRKNSSKYGAVWAEFLAFKYDIPLHVFEQNIKGNVFKAFLQTGRGGASVYYPSCIESYRKTKLDSMLQEIGEAYGRQPTTISYGCDKTEYADSLPPYILGGRNSSFLRAELGLNSETWYGQGTGTNYHKNFSNRENMLSRSAGGRYYADITNDNISAEKSANFVKKQVSITANSHGFYTNFMHWHDYYKNTNDSIIEGVAVMEPLFDAMNKGLQGSRNSSLDYNEAIEYLYAKEAVDSLEVVGITDEALKIKIKHSRKSSADYSVIATPITIKVPKYLIEDYTMEHTKKSPNIASIFEDEHNYFVNVLLNYEQPETVISLLKGNKRYSILHIDKPLELKRGWILNTVRANVPAKYVLFKRKKGAKVHEIEFVHRMLSFSEKYNLPNLEEGYDYFCGAITETRKSALINIEN